MKFNGKIEAIKTLRQSIGTLEIIQARVDDGYSATPMCRVLPMNLKDAKDLVEAIMELGAQAERDKQAVTRDLINQLYNRVNPLDDKIHF